MLRSANAHVMPEPGAGRLKLLADINARVCRWTMYVACACLVGLLSVVVYGVVLRYGFNNSPPYVEQIALLLVINVAMFGAAAGVRDAGHIGLDSFVVLLPPRLQFASAIFADVMVLLFAAGLVWGGIEMSVSTGDSTIPTLGISEAFRYLPVVVGGVAIASFSIEHMLARIFHLEVKPSWH